jgi:hypothetical protein
MHEVPPTSDGRPPQRPAQPYFDWALATGFSYLREGAWIPLLIEFDPEAAKAPRGNEKLTALEAFATRRWLSEEPRTLDDAFVIPELFAKSPALLRSSPDFNFCIGLIRRDAGMVRGLASTDGWTRTIRRVEIGPPVNLARKSAPATLTSGTIRPEHSDRSRASGQPDRAGFMARIGASIRRGIERLRRYLGGAPLAGTPGSGAPDPLPAPLTLPPTVPPPAGGTNSPAGGSSSPGSGSGGSAGPVARVVIAVIDQGFAFANAAFSGPGHSQIEYLWQQNMLGTSVPMPSLTMSFTPGFELDKAAIKKAHTDARVAGGDEDWIYRNVGGLDLSKDGYKPLARRRTHGTHVLDLAAGELNASLHPIIAVDLPEDAVGDPAGSTLAVQAAWGLIYALDRAESLRQPNEVLPVVANISYGPHEGPHDGTALFETFMDRLWTLADGSDTPLEIVLAAGNFRQTRTHAQFSLAPAPAKTTLQWRLQPCSLSPSLMEIWVPPGSGQSVQVTLSPPVPTATLRPITVVASQPSDAVLAAGSSLYSAQHVTSTVPNGATVVVLAIARTAPDPAGGWGSAVAPSGLWTVTVSSTSAVPGVEAWIKRSDTLSGRRAKGRQSYFDDPAYPRFAPNTRPYDFDPPTSTSYVRRIQTLSGIATGDKTRIIGGFRDSDGYPARYSSHGMRRVGGVLKGPDWLECSEESDVLRGLLAAGTRSGSVAVMNGTSVAAPQATRWIAQAWLGLAKGKRPPAGPGLKAPSIPPKRPIPAADLAAIGAGLAPFTPRRRQR